MKFELQEINGISELKVNIAGPGVLVARGPNGAGKTNAVQALRAANGDDSAKAEPSDGASKGEVRGDRGEVIFSVGNRKKRDGLPAVRLVSAGAIGRLIEPGIKDDKLAAKDRLRALLTIMPLPADDAAKMELTANDEELQLWIKTDPSRDAMELGESVRKRANELANELEKQSAEATGEQASMAALVNDLGELNYQAGELKAAEALAASTARDAAVKTQTAQARQQLEEQQAKIKASLGEKPNNWQVTQRIDRLSAEIAELDAKLAGLNAELRNARTERVRIDEALRVWESQAELLKRPLEGPTLAEAAEAVEAAQAAQRRLVDARKVDVARQYLERHQAAKERAERTADRAKQLRGIAAGTAVALGRLLERRGLPNLTIKEGFLTVLNHKGRAEDFARLSLGERTKLAIEIALLGMKDTLPVGETRLPIIPLEPEFWNALDPSKKPEIHRVAVETGVCLVTEEPGDGELRFETLN